MADLLVVVPVLNRPHRVRPFLEALYATTPHPFSALFVVDRDDVAEHEAIVEAGVDYRCSTMIWDGGWASKLNAAIRASDQPLIFAGADDLRFEPGWYEAAMRAFRVPRIQVVGVNDMCSRRVRLGRHATHFVLTRAYAETPMVDGHMGPFSEVYDHSAVDDEFVAVARQRRVIAFATDSHVTHLHPDNGLGEMDATYHKGRENISADLAMFSRRRRIYRF